MTDWISILKRVPSENGIYKVRGYKRNNPDEIFELKAELVKIDNKLFWKDLGSEHSNEQMPLTDIKIEAWKNIEKQ